MAAGDAHDDHDGHAHGECGASALHKHMDCQKLVSLLTEYVEGDIPPTEKAALEQHLGYCPPCVGFLADYKKASAACRESLLKQVPVDLEARLLSFLRDKVAG